MATFVLVPGAWLGGWAWNKITPTIVRSGHRVYPITLTGMGDRVHLASDSIGIETAVQDVLNVIDYNDLKDFVLVGHSFAGKVAAAVADRAADKVGMIIYLDAYSPERIRTPQGSFPDEFPVKGSVVPFPEEILGVVGKDVERADREWMISKASPTPVRYFRDPITISGKIDAVKRSYIFCTGGDTLAWYMSQSAGKAADEVLKAKLDGPYKIVESGHWPMITKPDVLAKDLIYLAKRKVL